MTNRRDFLKIGALAGVGLAVDSSTAQAAAPKVWLNMTQQELDDAYTQTRYAANAAQVAKRYSLNSEYARGVLGAPERHAYGTGPDEMLDVFRAKGDKAPVNIFIHGGAWKSGTAQQYSFLAETFVRAGACCVIPDFSSVLELNGDLSRMAAQVRQTVCWVYQNAARIGCDPERIYVSGHSSGAHLAGVLLTTDWKKEYGLPADVLKGGMCCSGMYDLKPVRLSVRSSYVHITDAIEDAISPQRHIDLLAAPVIVAWGSLETPEFFRQSREFAEQCKAAGKSVQTIVLQEYNHFEVLETLANPYSPLARATLAQMGLGN